MTATVIVRCDGSPTDRPGMTLERCRAFLPTRADTGTQAREEAVDSGWAWTPAGRDLCPACARGAGQ